MLCQCLLYSKVNQLCCCSVAQSCPTLCDPMDCSTPGLPVPHHLLKLAQVHVHCIGGAIQSSHPLTPSSPSALSFSQYQEEESAICIHTTPLFLDFLPIQIIIEHWVEFLVLYSRFSLVIYFIHNINSVYMFVMFNVALFTIARNNLNVHQQRNG